jgi:hypothetical protein
MAIAYNEDLDPTEKVRNIADGTGTRYYWMRILIKNRVVDPDPSVLAWIRIRIELKCWIRIESIRIHNPDLNTLISTSCCKDWTESPDRLVPVSSTAAVDPLVRCGPVSPRLVSACLPVRHPAARSSPCRPGRVWPRLGFARLQGRHPGFRPALAHRWGCRLVCGPTCPNPWACSPPSHSLTNRYAKA